MPHPPFVDSGPRLIKAIGGRKRNRVLDALFAPWTPKVRPLLLALGLGCALVVAGVVVLVRAKPYLPFDDDVLKAIQTINYGPLEAAFPFFSWVGGPGGGIYMQATSILIVLLLNRRAWLLAVAAIAGGAWYPLLVGLADRPRPVLSQVIRITEHPGSTSFPSGHLIFITLSLGLVMLCAGHRYLPKPAIPIGWAVVAAIVLLAAISRVYVGAHWPLDVLASILIAGGWLALITSIRWISDRALDPKAP
jgi:membrane-associated phospholipid phosphatase